ncbi:hypothetical protein OGATHE_003645 [Ogataea polymorpha]|uniref:Uncharacterized protein n=1 Tax=Ogataea polymorpha TaxID=460523 RepID=A0A9P8P404_9ASCO|nr:hypothetical protein OGATHE_003645 [Ogataea polymorpha]
MRVFTWNELPEGTSGVSVIWVTRQLELKSQRSISSSTLHLVCLGPTGPLSGLVYEYVLFFVDSSKAGISEMSVFFYSGSSESTSEVVKSRSTVLRLEPDSSDDQIFTSSSYVESLEINEAKVYLSCRVPNSRALGIPTLSVTDSRPASFFWLSRTSVVGGSVLFQNAAIVVRAQRVQRVRTHRLLDRARRERSPGERKVSGGAWGLFHGRVGIGRRWLSGGCCRVNKGVGVRLVGAAATYGGERWLLRVGGFSCKFVWDRRLKECIKLSKIPVPTLDLVMDRAPADESDLWDTCLFSDRLVRFGTEAVDLVDEDSISSTSTSSSSSLSVLVYSLIFDLRRDKESLGVIGEMVGRTKNEPVGLTSAFDSGLGFLEGMEPALDTDEWLFRLLRKFLILKLAPRGVDFEDSDVIHTIKAQ